jgi:hypothetical protein
MSDAERPTKATGPKGDWKERFLRKLAERANVSEAARLAGINRQYAYHARDQDPEFAAGWDEAVEEAVDKLEAAAWARAKKQSDALMTLLLKAHRPEKYAERLVVLQKVAKEVVEASDEDLLKALGYDATISAHE